MQTTKPNKPYSVFLIILLVLVPFISLIEFQTTLIPNVHASNLPWVLVNGNAPLYYIPVIIKNTRNVATSAGFQQNVTINSNTHSSWYAANLKNVNWQWGNGSSSSSMVYSWLENGETSASTSSVYWLKVGSIPANSYVVCYQCIYATSVNCMTQNTSSTPTTGAEPTYNVSAGSTYGFYDNGKKVFVDGYWNFNGTSLPPGWTNSSSSGTPKVTVSNGVTIQEKVTSSTAYAYCYTTGSYSGDILEARITKFTRAAGYTYAALDMLNVTAGSGQAQLASSGYSYYFLGGTSSAVQYLYEYVSGFGASITSNSINAKNYPATYSLYWNATAHEETSANYTAGVMTSTDNTIAKPSTFYIDLALEVSGGGTNTGNYTVQWVRIRPHPPNSYSVMPSVSIISPNIICSKIGFSNLIQGFNCTLYCKWTTVFPISLSKYLFGDNNTGSWQNDSSWSTFPSGQTTAWTNRTITLNSAGKVVQWEIWANDTFGDRNSTGIQTIPSWLSGWNYRIGIGVNGTGTSAGTGYQFPINVYSGFGASSGNNLYENKCASVFPNDTAFTTANGLTPINFWIQDQSFTTVSSNYTTMFQSSVWALSYASVYDGYLWIVQSLAYSNSTSGCLSKCYLNGTIIKKIYFPSYACWTGNYLEMYSAYVYNKTVYVAGEIGTWPSGQGGGIIATYYEGNLSRINWWNSVSGTNTSNFGVCMCPFYDPLQNVILVSGDTSYGCSFVEVVPTITALTTNTAYKKIFVSSNINGWCGECWARPFKGAVYATDAFWNSSGPPNYIYTWLLRSTNLASWTVVWKFNETKSLAHYYPSISVNNNWIAVGVESNAITGTATARIEYSTNGSAGTWHEYNTGLAVTPYEDHLNVNFVDNTSLLLVEWSHRNGPAALIYTFNCLNGIFTGINCGPIYAYNDRVVSPIISASAVIYVSNCMWETNSSIFKFSITPASATFWVNVPTNLTGTTTTIYMYYGKVSASTSSSNIHTTFPAFADDFRQDSSLNTTKWENNLIEGTTPTITFSSTNGISIYNTQTGLAQSYQLSSRAKISFSGAKIITEIAQNGTDNYNATLFVCPYNTTSAVNLQSNWMANSYSTNIAWEKKVSGTTSTLATSSSGVSNAFSVIIADLKIASSGSDVWYLNGTQKYASSSEALWSNSTNLLYILDQQAASYHEGIEVKYIAIAKYSSPEPLVHYFGTKANLINITITSSPSGSGFVSVDGNPITTPHSFSWPVGSMHNLTANSNVIVVAQQEREVYLNWSDGGSITHNYVVGSSATITANFYVEYNVTISSSGIGSDSSGTVATLNGTTRTQVQLPYSKWYNASSWCTYSFTSPVSSTTNGKSYVWSSTSGLGQSSQINTFTVTNYGTITGTYLTYLQATTSSVASVSISPGSATLEVGQSQTFTASVSNGTAPYAYQWYLNGSAVSGATSSSWAFTPTSVGSYTVHVNVTDSVGMQAKSNTANVTVNIKVNTHDVAVTNVAPYRTIQGQGLSDSIEVTAANWGSYTETFNVTAYANTTAIATQTVTLTSGNSTTITFTWNTTGFAYGDYTISAYATPVPGQTDTSNNTLTCASKVLVTIIGDVIGDRYVDGLDITIIGSCLFTSPGEKNWNPNCDLADTGYIGGIDITIAGEHLFQSS